MRKSRTTRARLKSAPPANVGDKQEWCAALLYLADSSPFTDAALGRLSPTERVVLFPIFGVGQAGGAAVATKYLIEAINCCGPNDQATFISLLPASDNSTATQTTVQAANILKQLPVKSSPSATASELREIVAATVWWCDTVMKNSADLQALTARLCRVLEDMFKTPKLDAVLRAASAIALWQRQNRRQRVDR